MNPAVSKYDAVIFDLFGTLVDFGPEGYFRKACADLADSLSIPADGFLQLLAKMTENRFIGHYGSLEDEFRYICAQFGEEPTNERIAEVIELDLSFYKEFLEPRDGAVETINRLRSSGFKVAIVTDCPNEVPLVWEETRFASLPDAVVFSCSAQVAKPDPRIYMKACEQLGVKPERCLYIGDGSGRELTGAKSVGMDAVLIRVGYDTHMDFIRPDVPGWRGRTISHLSEVPDIVE